MKTCKMGCGKMKAGGPVKKVKKMAVGGQALNKAHGFAKNQTGGGNTKMGIYGVPNAGPTGPNREGINTMKVGGATDEKCWPGKPGCGHSRANRVNKRRSAANKAAPVVKKILGAAAGAGAAIGAYAKNIGGIKDKIQGLKQQKMGGTTKKMARGGALKPVPSENVGLSKLPTPVRNKMGYMKKGGSKKK